MSTLWNIIMSINFVASLCSLPGNIFIVVVNLLDFCKNRRLPLSDQLIFGFSVFSLLYGLQEGSEQCKELFHLANNEYKKGTQAIKYLNLCTLWCSTLLSIHFCLKIVTIPHWFYIGLQRNFPKLFPWIIITFLLGNLFLSLYSALETNCEVSRNSTSNAITMQNLVKCYWLLINFLTVCFLCSSLCSVSALTILNYVCKHMRRIQENTEGSRSPHMDAHIRTVKTVTTLLVTNIVIFISMAILGIYDMPWAYLCNILISICYVFSSYFLIKGTKKLYIAMAKLPNRCSCFRGE